jgi:hypothetical protein
MTLSPQVVHRQHLPGESFNVADTEARHAHVADGTAGSAPASERRAGDALSPRRDGTEACAR